MLLAVPAEGLVHSSFSVRPAVLWVNHSQRPRPSLTALHEHYVRHRRPVLVIGLVELVVDLQVSVVEVGHCTWFGRTSIADVPHSIVHVTQFNDCSLGSKTLNRSD